PAARTPDQSVCPHALPPAQISSHPDRLAAMTAPTRRDPPRVAVIGGGPAGLMAAERLAAEGLQVDVFDAMPSVGRKFLMAGRGGLNLTHSEAAAPFLARYGERAAQLAPWLQAMDATA